MHWASQDFETLSWMAVETSTLGAITRFINSFAKSLWQTCNTQCRMHCFHHCFQILEIFMMKLDLPKDEKVFRSSWRKSQWRWGWTRWSYGFFPQSSAAWQWHGVWRGVRSDAQLSSLETRFQKCSQSGKNGSKHPMLSISMAFNVISCKKVKRNTQKLKIADFTM